MDYKHTKRCQSHLYPKMQIKTEIPFHNYQTLEDKLNRSSVFVLISKDSENRS